MYSRWSRALSWGALLVLGALSIIFGYLLFTAPLQKGAELGVRILLFFVIGVALAAAWLTRPQSQFPARFFGSTPRLETIGFLGVAVLSAFGVGTSLLAFFPVRDQKAPASIAAAPIRGKIAGLWGESGCKVTYRFRVTGKALIVDSEQRPEGTEPYRLVATITHAEGNAMHVTGETPEAARGKAAVFTYSSNGVTERLRWDDRARPVQLDLDRCD